jgi:hypothetical protein
MSRLEDRMPRYLFQLHDGERPVEDGDVWESSREPALAHAETVAGELMRGREKQTRSWRLDVYENGELICQIPFATVDPTLDHLRPPLRRMVERSYQTIHSAQQTYSAARATMRESRALVAISRGKPYLAAQGGEPTIRSGPPPIQHKKHRKGYGA